MSQKMFKDLQVSISFHLNEDLNAIFPSEIPQNSNFRIVMWIFKNFATNYLKGGFMSRKGPEIGKGMLDFVEDLS